MNKPKLWVMLKLADGRVITQRLSRIDSYTNEGVKGFAGRYTLPAKEVSRWRKSEQYVFFTDKYEIQTIDERSYIGQNEGSCGAVPFFSASSDAPGENYAVLLRTHAYADAYRTLKGDLKIPIGMILIGIVLVGAVLLGLNYMRGLAPMEAEPVFDSPPQEMQQIEEGGE